MPEIERSERQKIYSREEKKNEEAKLTSYEADVIEVQLKKA